MLVFERVCLFGVLVCGACIAVGLGRVGTRAYLVGPTYLLIKYPGSLHTVLVLTCSSYQTPSSVAKWEGVGRGFGS